MSAPSRGTKISGEENISEPYQCSLANADSNLEGANQTAKNVCNGNQIHSNQLERAHVKENGVGGSTTSNSADQLQNSSTGKLNLSLPCYHKEKIFNTLLK